MLLLIHIYDSFYTNNWDNSDVYMKLRDKSKTTLPE